MTKYKNGQYEEGKVTIIHITNFADKKIPLTQNDND